MAGGQGISVRFDFECRSAGSSRQNPMKKNWRGLIVVRKYFQKIRARTQLWLWSQAFISLVSPQPEVLSAELMIPGNGFWGSVWWGCMGHGLPRALVRRLA